jgi:hypothetical protein
MLKIHAELQDAAFRIWDRVETVHLDELTESQIKDALDALASIDARLEAALSPPLA